LSPEIADGCAVVEPGWFAVLLYLVNDGAVALRRSVIVLRSEMISPVREVFHRRHAARKRRGAKDEGDWSWI
jgi:hypothetical protein